MSLYHHPTHLLKALAEREHNGLLRKLSKEFPAIDFCSNDYLGFSRSGLISSKLQQSLKADSFGATGSRVMSGNSQLTEEAEKQIALFHHGQAALIYNSGYDANLGLLSSIPQKTDLILYDENIHASLFDGLRLSNSTHYKFSHNDVHLVEELIQRHQKNFENIFVVVESVYALDGDTAPLLELADICQSSKNIFLIVDEAHALGVFGRQGRGMCNALGIEQRCFARIYTYGKAMGCQGAAIVGSNILRNYLINFSRSFIYTTALPHPCIDAILYAYQLLIETDQKDHLQQNIAYFYSKATSVRGCVKSQSAIQSFIAGSNEAVDRLIKELEDNNIHARPIKTPAVKHGNERVRFSIHSYNTREEIDLLIDVLSSFKKERVVPAFE
jgi:8-amino-7-oxononanoate synthase